MTVESLQRVFKTLTDPTRVRLLALLEREELAVQDLVQVLGVAQSTVSRHLSILRDAGLLHDRRAGTWTYYRFVPPVDGEWRDAWAMAARALADDPLAARDNEALDRLLRDRAFRARDWFDSVGPEWDAMREVFNDDLQRARAIGKLLPRDLRVVDIGTGTGILARDLARSGVQVVAVDHSSRMLVAAETKLAADAIEHVDLRHGDATELPLDDAEVDAAVAHMVLHYVASPGEAIREMARVVKPGGRIVVVDFVHNDREWLRTDLGLLWPGFPVDTVRAWFADAACTDIDLEICEPTARGTDLPATFIASATRTDTNFG